MIFLTIFPDQNHDKNVNWVRSLLLDSTSLDHLKYMQKLTQFEVESGVVVVDKHVNLIGLAASSFILMDKAMNVSESDYLTTSRPTRPTARTTSPQAKEG
jgi:hypothetical protein